MTIGAIAASEGEFNILGCLEVVGPTGRLTLPSNRQRALVAALALQPGAVVPTWRLVEALWGERPPRTAVRSLHSHVARLRLQLDACSLGGVLQTRGPGYLLAVSPSVVDASRFEEHAQVGRTSLASGLAGPAVEILVKGLNLWRGEALADAQPTGWTAAQAIRLGELRQVAMEDRCEALLCLGRYGDALVELDRLLAADSVRERLVGLRMIALCGAGRVAEALDAFQRLRVRLGDELGVDPSPEISELYTAMLRGVVVTELRAPGTVAAPRVLLVPAAPRPAQLPARVGYFTGRTSELKTLERLVGAEERTKSTVVLICGQGGIGKTSLAIEYAHRVVDRFPDGQLFVDIRGQDALAPGKIMAVLLRCLGVPDDELPAEPGERVGLYRSLLAGKRMLIVLDNATAASQVTPAIPNTGGSMLVVTSRRNLAALATYTEVHPVVLDVLATEEAADLLVNMLGASRVARESDAAVRLTVLCGRLPLALRIAGAKLVTQPGLSIGGFASELDSGDRLFHLGLDDGGPSVEAVFNSAYQPLSPSARRLFCLLGLHPGPHLGAPLAAAIAGFPVDTPHDALAELLAAHLITQPLQGQYRLHDLVRLFAHRRAVVDEPEHAQTDAAQRLVDWYLHAANAANQILDPSQNRIAPELRHRAPPLPFAATRKAALAFLESERDNLVPVVRFASEQGQPLAACQLVYLLASFFEAHGHWSQRVEMCQYAVQAAVLVGDAAIEAEMHRALGVAYRATQQLDLALDSHLRALALLRPLGDERGMAYVYNNIGGASVELRRFDAALEAYEQSRQLHRNCGNDMGVAVAERNLGYVRIRMDRAELSFTHLHGALAGSRALGHRRLEASVLDSLGEAYLRTDQHDEALRCLREALAASQALGDRRHEMDALDNIGLAQLARGDAATAATCLSEALSISRTIAHRHGEARILNHLGEAYLRLGYTELAGQQLTASAALRRAIPDDYEEARLHRNLGELAHRAGDPAAATHWTRAASLYRKANASAEADSLANRMG